MFSSDVFLGLGRAAFLAYDLFDALSLYSKVLHTPVLSSSLSKRED